MASTSLINCLTITFLNTSVTTILNCLSSSLFCYHITIMRVCFSFLFNDNNKNNGEWSFSADLRCGSRYLEYILVVLCG